MEIVEQCVDSLRSVSGMCCANCTEPGILLCGGCSAVFYCSVQCQKAHRKKHVHACSPSPLAQFTKSFIEMVDAFYIHGFTDHARNHSFTEQLAKMPKDMEVVPLL